MGSSESKISSSQNQQYINTQDNHKNQNQNQQKMKCYSIQNNSKSNSQDNVQYSQYLEDTLSQTKTNVSYQEEINMNVNSQKNNCGEKAKVISSSNIDLIKNNQYTNNKNSDLQKSSSNITEDSQYFKTVDLKYVDEDEDIGNNQNIQLNSEFNINRGRQTTVSRNQSEIPDYEDTQIGCCLPSIFTKSRKQTEQNSNKYSNFSNSQINVQQKLKKHKKQKLKDSEWYQYLKEICVETYNERSPFYRQLQMEIKAQYKLSDAKNHKQFVHQFCLQSLEDSQKIFQKHLQKYMEKSNSVKDDPFMMNALQIKLLEELMRETELMNEAKISIDFEKSIPQEAASQYSQMPSQQRQGLKSFLRAGSYTSFKFKNSESSNYSTLPMKKQNQFLMNNTTLIIEAQNLTENEKLYTSVYFYKQITKLIEKQIKMRSHPLGFMRSFFQQQFRKKYDPKKNEVVDIYEMSTFFSEFLEFYLDVIRVYYDLDELLNDFPFEVESFLNEENLTNFLSCILFSNQFFYENVMYQLGKEDQTLVKTHFIENLRQLKHKNIQFFDIPADFQLNQNTIDYNIQKGNLLEADIRSKQTSAASLQQKNEIFEPYLNVIQYFQKLDQVSSPLHKLKIIIKTTQMIDQAIKTFYSENSLMLGKKVHYDADQFISLFVYIIVQAQSYNLYESCRLIENFTSRGTLNSASGYLLVTLTGCVHHIASLNIDEMERYSVKDSYSMQSPSQFRMPSVSTFKQKNFQVNKNLKYEFSLKEDNNSNNNNLDQDEELEEFNNKKGQLLLKKESGELIDRINKNNLKKPHGLSENLEDSKIRQCSEDNNYFKKTMSQDFQENPSVFLDENTFNAKNHLNSDMNDDLLGENEDKVQGYFQFNNNNNRQNTNVNQGIKEQRAGGTNSQEYDNSTSIQTPVFNL